MATTDAESPLFLDTSVVFWLKTWRDRCRVLDETEIVTETLWQLYSDYSFGGKQVHDANLIATLYSHGLILWSRPIAPISRALRRV